MPRSKKTLPVILSPIVKNASTYSQVQELRTKAANLSNALNKKTDIIRDLENALREEKVHFPYSMEIKKAELHSPKALTEDYANKIGFNEPFFADFITTDFITIARQYLAWEEDGNKNYRLLLIEKHQITIYYDTGYGGMRTKALEEVGVSKIAVIETPLRVRLELAEYIDEFIDNLGAFFDSSRIRIEGIYNFPTSEDEVPF